MAESAQQLRCTYHIYDIYSTYVYCIRTIYGHTIFSILNKKG